MSLIPPDLQSIVSFYATLYTSVNVGNLIKIKQRITLVSKLGYEEEMTII